MSLLLRNSLSRLTVSDLSPRLIASVFSQRDVTSILGRFESRRGMAENRFYPIKGASHETGITEEVRDLIRNVKHAENIETWEREKGVPEPITFNYLKPNPEDMDNDQFISMTYYPHRGEDLSEWEKEPSPVLLVQRMKTLRNQPWWHKETCEKFGLGEGTYDGKRVAVPNMSHYTQQLFTIKHLIKILPVSFPNGLPPENEFDPEAVHVTYDGKFLYHPKLKERSRQIEEGEENSEHMLITHRIYSMEARKHFKKPWSTPLGNHNYHRNTSYADPKKKDQVTDSAIKHQY